MLSELEGSIPEYSLQPTGRCKLGGNSSSFKFNEPILPSLTSKQEHAQLQRGGYLEPWWQSEYSPTEGILGGHSGMHHATTLIPLYKMSLHQNKVLGDCRHDSTLATLLCRMSSCCWPYGIKFKRNKTNENTNSMESYQMSALDSIPGLGLTPSSGSWVSLPIREVRLHNVQSSISGSVKSLYLDIQASLCHFTLQSKVGCLMTVEHKCIYTHYLLEVGVNTVYWKVTPIPTAPKQKCCNVKCISKWYSSMLFKILQQKLKI